ncbi:MAG: helix-turn-helix domain-containing protein [Fulvimarina manganoxydans]|uniref:helix-turn-helix domain-containing protein n=1 Tax=Fulvimarina manganoxydans TaxID=937218 RepID=UPI002356B706|nr:helix-turn-helix domain-containing protein [Fulvimarina manganoxydans]MCK5934056.1 helix-turn-helix domain-containing protein [Fulvimarina manganoxydans]
MTEKQWRSPITRRAQANASDRNPIATERGSVARWQAPRDLLSDLDTQQKPHENFEKRATIWREFRDGRISVEEASRRSALLEKPAGSGPIGMRGQGGGPGQPRPPAPRPRSTRPAPGDSRQYSNPMATTAARDDRLTPQAKALLQVIRARVGKGYETICTKGALAGAISRSTRSIARYLRDLERCGYLKTSIRRDGRGYHLGLVVTITEKVLPFFAETKGLARWLGDSVFGQGFMPFATQTPGGASWPVSATATDPFGVQGMTNLSSKNQTQNDSYLKNSSGQRVIAGSGQYPPN